MMGMGDPDDDPFYGSMRTMDNMINSMFNDPFGMMNGLMGGHRVPSHPQRVRPNPNQMTQLSPMGQMNQMNQMNQISQMNQMNQMSPFGGMFGGGLFGGGMMGGMLGFPNMNNLFDNMQSSFGNDPNCHSFSSSTVMTMSSGPNGQPQVYQASSTTRSAPGGIKETKKTVCDSRSGVKKMAIGHHIGDRAHIIEREKNVYTGEQEQRVDLVNLDEDEAPVFNREWEAKTGTVGVGAVTYGRSNSRYQEALPSTAPVSPSTTSSLRAKARAAARARRSQLSLTYPSRVEITEVTDDDDNQDANSPSEDRSASPIIEYPSPSNSQPRREGRDRERYHPQGRTHIQEHHNRKRDHEDDHEERRRHHKSRKPY